MVFFSEMSYQVIGIMPGHVPLLLMKEGQYSILHGTHSMLAARTTTPFLAEAVVYTGLETYQVHYLAFFSNIINGLFMKVTWCEVADQSRQVALDWF